jgi:C4-dicarboxylate-specific signal transduction histidine kinase
VLVASECIFAIFYNGELAFAPLLGKTPRVMLANHAWKVLSGRTRRCTMEIIAAKRTGDVLAPMQVDLARVTGLTTFVDEFTASIAHEVNQPLATIVTNGEACLRWFGREEPQLDRARANIAAKISSALRTSDIIRQLRALSTKASVRRAELKLNEVIEEVVQLIEPEVVRHNVSLRLDFASDLSPVTR